MSMGQSASVKESPSLRRDRGCTRTAGVSFGTTSRLVAMVQLTKPKIMLLVLVTGAAALVLEGSLLAQPLHFALFLLGLYMTGGAANAFNQYSEHDIDSRMSRTRTRRPLPRGKIPPRAAFLFAAGLGVSGVVLLGVVFNPLTAALALGTMLFYSLLYTLWLKKATPQNIVIGGAAGAMAPVGAWAAATGSTALTPWILFLIVFLWTPPHFWSLALRFKGDYDQSGLLMMPQAKGSDRTLRYIFVYVLALAIISLTYGLIGGGWPYIGAATVLNLIFIKRARAALKTKDDKKIWSVFTYSIFYLFGLFSAMVLDKLFQ